MTTKLVPGQLIALSDAAQVASEATARIALALRAALNKSGRATLALSGGHTPRDTYRLLAREPRLDWTSVSIFWVDERGVPPTHDRSNFRWAKATLLDGASVPGDRVYRMRGDAADLEAAARDYERLIRERVESDADGMPALDVVILGIGEDGHTASLFPHESTVGITDRLVVAVPAKGQREARLTLTAPVIEHARSVFVIVLGAGKHEALERVWSIQGSVQETPARIVRACRGRVMWIIDKAAGGVDALTPAST